ncbi:hypothetical protein CIB95_15255 [Lottiidibacillus patelloidae]|uniref:DUF58 domain-containing protein n=1 Tax=Lottiidibacillus patelloidae TaxID=2670334 RepID=A0A263BPX7_9BACI|nr:DUF58 domain-containing protein [Lottiidibacillus patelloidae]OZM55793.1 hypothetical protein CIB95_15255 [Lottiidibacillus patelloidae]
MKQKVLAIISVITIFVTTFSYAMFQGGFVSWFLLYTILPFLAYQLVVIFLPLSHLKVTRELNKSKCTAGDKIEVTVHIKQPFPFPIFYLIVKDRLHPKLMRRVANRESSNHRMLFPRFKRHLSFTYEISKVPRGEYEFSEISVKFGDLFGFVERSHTFQTTTKLAVYPNDRGVEYPFRQEQVQKGNIHSRKKNHSQVTSVVGVREYVPGDRLSWVDWKASARTASLKTKEFEQTLKQEVVLLMDRTDNSEENKENLLFEKVVACTASLARSILHQGTGVSLLSIGSEKTDIPVYYGIEQKRRIDGHLLRVNADADRSLHNILGEVEKKWPPGITSVIVTSKLTENLATQINLIVSKKVKVDLYLVKMTRKLTEEENVLVRKLSDQRVRVEVVNGQHHHLASEGGEELGSA